ncbi:MAG TPA: macrolide family glycosyltransferase [Bryobacteraceae bacterium]|nr:macrolide family glycosyltransferase [Bryobacteraceae bacterium]
MSTAVVLVYPTHGHIAPALGVVAELVRRGERVVFYGTGRAREKIERTGAEFRLYARRHDAFNPTPPTGGLFSDMERLSALTEELLPGLLDEVSAAGADYLLVDTKSLWGRFVGQVLGLPAVTMSVVFGIRPDLISVPELVNHLYGGAPREGLLAGLRSLGHYFDICGRMDGHYGTAAPGIIGYLGNPHPLHIIFTSRAFQLRGEEFGDDFVFVGPSILPGRDGSCEFPFDRLSKAPLVYISLGTTFHDAPEFYQACFAAFGDMPWQVVLSTGGVPADALGTPSNFLVRSYVPQLQLLERADVFVTHGGMNSANEGLYHGVPLVVVPQRGDQYLVGARVAELGAGVTLSPRQVTAKALRDAVSKLLSEPTYRKAAEVLGESLRDAGGYRRAANVILERVSALREASRQASAERELAHT